MSFSCPFDASALTMLFHSKRTIKVGHGEIVSNCSAHDPYAHSSPTYVSEEYNGHVGSWFMYFTGIGQMVGDTTNGIWNESEGISLIIKVSHNNLILLTSLTRSH